MKTEQAETRNVLSVQQQWNKKMKYETTEEKKRRKKKRIQQQNNDMNEKP